MAIRNSAKAIVIHNNKILVNRCITENNEIYFSLPGGGQNQFETMENAVKREVLEETGYRVNVVKFIGLGEEILDNDLVNEKNLDYSHIIQHIFIANLINEETVEVIEKDYQQDECIWLSFEEAAKVTFKPCYLTSKISALAKSDVPLYFGHSRTSHDITK